MVGLKRTWCFFCQIMPGTIQILSSYKSFTNTDVLCNIKRTIQRILSVPAGIKIFIRGVFQTYPIALVHRRVLEYSNRVVGK